MISELPFVFTVVQWNRRLYKRNISVTNGKRSVCNNRVIDLRGRSNNLPSTSTTRWLHSYGVCHLFYNIRSGNFFRYNCACKKVPVWRKLYVCNTWAIIKKNAEKTFNNLVREMGRVTLLITFTLRGEGLHVVRKGSLRKTGKKVSKTLAR